ncbi:hypothetical protein TNCV_2082091 [Trichonephila clavipes]|nr:hypothetical protein TNCV_2082091 [Trichonephila clavipes]
MAINKEPSEEEQWGSRSRQTHIVVLNMEGIILAVRLYRAGRSGEIPEVFPGVVYQNDCSMANGLEEEKMR